RPVQTLTQDRQRCHPQAFRVAGLELRDGSARPTSILLAGLAIGGDAHSTRVQHGEDELCFFALEMRGSELDRAFAESHLLLQLGPGLLEWPQRIRVEAVVELALQPA